MDIWEKNTHVSDKAVNDLLNGVEDVEGEIYLLIKEYLTQFSTENGRFVKGQDFTKILNNLRKSLADIISETELDKNIIAFTDNFDEIEKNVIDLHKSENGIKVPKKILTPQKKFAIDSVVFSMKDANVNMKFIDPIKKLLYNRVMFGAKVLDTEKTLRKLVTGDSEKFGILRQWVGQIARDSINQYEGTLHQRVKTTYKLTKTRYIGSLVEDSRKQCERWVGMGIIEDKDLNSEISWANKNGSGMIQGTSKEDFSIKRGGYNCRHIAFPSI